MNLEKCIGITMKHAKRDGGGTVSGRTQQEHDPRPGIRKGFPIGNDTSAESWRMHRRELNIQKEKECLRQRDSISKSLKGTCKNSKEIPAAREEHGGEENLEMRGGRWEADRGQAQGLWQPHKAALCLLQWPSRTSHSFL